MFGENPRISVVEFSGTRIVTRDFRTLQWLRCSLNIFPCCLNVGRKLVLSSHTHLALFDRSLCSKNRMEIVSAKCGLTAERRVRNCLIDLKIKLKLMRGGRLETSCKM